MIYPKRLKKIKQNLKTDPVNQIKNIAQEKKLNLTDKMK